MAFEDVFTDPDFNANEAMPVSQNTFTFEDVGGRTRSVFVSQYASAEALQQVLDMGVVEGATSAINQIDDLLAA